MSHQSALQFIQYLASDETLQQQLPSSNAAEIIQAGAAVGFEFDANDYRTALSAYLELKGEELSDDALNMVAGGTGSDRYQTDTNRPWENPTRPLSSSGGGGSNRNSVF